MVADDDCVRMSRHEFCHADGHATYLSITMLLRVLAVVLLAPSYAWQTSRRTILLESVLLSLVPPQEDEEWTGTSLPILSIQQASSMDTWNMARWPDPILRRAASPVSPDLFHSSALDRACRLLRQTAADHGAVGLAAEQCGIDARIIVLLGQPAMINPTVVWRSPEVQMRVWKEHCLVLPPSFTAEVLRDASIVVEYQDPQGRFHQRRLDGEQARAFQHEFDHDRGILIADHVSLEEMSDSMRVIEDKGHGTRMQLAYARDVSLSRA